MPEPVLQKLTLLLDQADNGQVERLSGVMPELLSHGDLTCNVYVISGDLPGSMPHVNRIRREIGVFLKQHLFVRLYLHLVHPAPVGSLEAVRRCYQQIKGLIREFDEEGYRHQELPRLMLLPVLVPGVHSDPAALGELLGILKGLFMMPGLYLDKTTAFLSGEASISSGTEKIYPGRGHGDDPCRVLLGLHEYNLFEESCERLTSGMPFFRIPCSSGMVIAAKGGLVYPCMEAFRKQAPIGRLREEADVTGMIAGCARHIRDIMDCASCRERTLRALTDLSLDKETGHELGALLYHLGTLRQETENHVDAIQDYECSLKVSPEGESGSIYFRLGLSLTKTGDLDGAAEAFRRAEAIYGDQDYFHFHVGVCHYEKGDYGAAVEAFEKALSLEPQAEDLVRILIYTGTCCNYLGEYEKARGSLEQAKKMAPHVKEIYSALGFSCFQQKDFNPAIENLQKAVEIDPHSAIDFASLGANYREKGNITMAIAMFEKALALDPTMAAARENLERLRNIK